MPRIVLLLVALVQFVVLHGPTGQELFVNPKQITNIREPTGTDVRHFPRGTHCVVLTTDGKFIAVQEDCDAVRSRIDKLQ